jgi:hypothetical protein
MSTEFENLKTWIAKMASNIAKSGDPEPPFFASFLQNPKLPLQIIDLLMPVEESELEIDNAYYSACIFALDLCVAQLKSLSETNNKQADRILDNLMSYITKAIYSGQHTLSFWLPVLNAFYDVQIPLKEELSEAYLHLANEEDFTNSDLEVDNLTAIKDLIDELSDLTIFDKAETVFAQSHAMPPDFFADLIEDLYCLEEGRDIALLSLLHPNPEVREMAVMITDAMIEQLTLSSVSLTRLQTIKNWYPADHQELFDRWIKIQRKKEVVFCKYKSLPILKIKASEVDGSGAQGIFIQIKAKSGLRLIGLLLKQDYGIKDCWLTPYMKKLDMESYCNDAFDDSVTFRVVDLDYVFLMLSHHLALTLNNGMIPNLHFLEIQELLNLHIQPKLIDIPSLINDLSVQISPFTQEIIDQSLKRSKSWLTQKPFTESWFIENSNIDKLVNRCSTFVDGTKVCAIDEAIDAVFEQELEPHREKWIFHFLWTTLWIKSYARKNEKTWHDSFFLAYTIYSGTPLKSIPVMQEITRQSVFNSIETMNERRTHLNQE